MFCAKCGQQIEDGTTFCRFCGSKVENKVAEDEKIDDTVPAAAGEKKDTVSAVTGETNAEASAAEGEKKDTALAVNREIKSIEVKHVKIKKGAVVIIAVVTIVAAGIASSFAIVLNSPAKKVVDSLRSGDYIDASGTYTRKVKNHKFQEWLLEKMLHGTVGDTVDDYKAEKISYEDAQAELALIEEVGGDSYDAEVTQAVSSVKALYDSRNAFDMAQNYMSYEDYTDAIEQYRLVIEDDDNYSKAQDEIEKCGDNIRNTVLEDTKSPSDIYSYQSAIAEVENALVTLPDDDELTSRLENLKASYSDIVKKQLESDVKKYISDGDYASAISSINDALSTLPGDKDLESLYESTKTSYEESIKKSVDESLKIDDYDTALNTITQAEGLLDDDTYFNDLYSATQTARPVTIKDLATDYSYYYNNVYENSAVDVNGNTYNSVNLFEIESYNDGWTTGEGYVTCTLNGDFSNLTGQVVLENSTDDGDCTFTVSGADGTELYSKKLTKGMKKPADVNVDVSGQDKITIKLSLSDGEQATMKALMYRFIFTKSV